MWNAVVVLREIQALGYEGGSTILRDYVQPKRPQRQNKATVRFETPPGRQLQTDWGEILTDSGARTAWTPSTPTRAWSGVSSTSGA